VVQVLVQRTASSRVLEERQQDHCEGYGTSTSSRVGTSLQRIPKRERVPLFSHAADVWLANKAGLAPNSKERYEQCMVHLKEEFGKALVCDVGERYRGVRKQAAGGDLGQARRKQPYRKLRNWSPCGEFCGSSVCGGRTLERPDT
jgi:hypothetical protein